MSYRGGGDVLLQTRIHHHRRHRILERGSGYARVAGDAVDIGAVELQTWTVGGFNNLIGTGAGATNSTWP